MALGADYGPGLLRIVVILQRIVVILLYIILILGTMNPKEGNYTTTEKSDRTKKTPRGWCDDDDFSFPS